MSQPVFDHNPSVSYIDFRENVDASTSAGTAQSDVTGAPSSTRLKKFCLATIETIGSKWAKLLGVALILLSIGALYTPAAPAAPYLFLVGATLLYGSISLSILNWGNWLTPSKSQNLYIPRDSAVSENITGRYLSEPEDDEDISSSKDDQDFITDAEIPTSNSSIGADELPGQSLAVDNQTDRTVDSDDQALPVPISTATTDEPLVNDGAEPGTASEAPAVRTIVSGAMSIQADAQTYLPTVQGTGGDPGNDSDIECDESDTESELTDLEKLELEIHGLNVGISFYHHQAECGRADTPDFTEDEEANFLLARETIPPASDEPVAVT